jgi:hypothetical protein
VYNSDVEPDRIKDDRKMPVKVQRLPGEAIVIATCSGVLDVPALKDMFAQTAALMDASDSLIYRIADYYGVTSPFADLLASAQKASQDGAPASTTDPRIKPTFVGSDEWQTQARAAFGQNPFGTVQIPIFGRVDDAIAHARQELAKED